MTQFEAIRCAHDGASLEGLIARLEASIALEGLIERTKSFERTGEGVLPLHPSIVFRGVTSLPLRLAAA